MFKAIMGVLPVWSGQVHFEGRSIGGRRPSENVAAGLTLVPQGGRVFSELSVEDNLDVGGYLVRSRSVLRERLESAYALFPRLAERRRQEARTLSGGERQALSLARALMLKPRLLLLDEPSGGLAPAVGAEILKLVQRINRDLGVAALIIEQRVRQVLDIAHRVQLLTLGRIVYDTTKPAELLDAARLKALYVG
jgi:branched-chain amino acid transport system ATP-binding protein